METIGKLLKGMAIKQSEDGSGTVMRKRGKGAVMETCMGCPDICKNIEISARLKNESFSNAFLTAQC